MKYFLIILLSCTSLFVRSQELALKEVLKIYTSDSVTTRQFLKSNGWIFSKDSINNLRLGNRQMQGELKYFILPLEKRSQNDTLEILWWPKPKRGLMAIQYKFNNKNTYEDIVTELEKMGATLRWTEPLDEETVYSYHIPSYEIFLSLGVKNSKPFKYSLMILTPAQNGNNDTTKQITTNDITRQASFPGGDAAWRKYLNKILNNNIDVLTLDGKSGTCRIRFIIYEDGSIGDVSAITMKDSELARISIQAIRNAPKFIPAMYHGKYIKAFREEPIGFNISNQ